MPSPFWTVRHSYGVMCGPDSTGPVSGQLVSVIELFFAVPMPTTSVFALPVADPAFVVSRCAGRESCGLWCLVSRNSR